MALPFVPVNEIEKDMVAAMKGEMFLEVFFEHFLKARIAVPSETAVHSVEEKLTPILFDKDGVTFMGVFTDVNRVSQFTNRVKHHLLINGLECFAKIDKRYGVVINPGFECCMELRPEGIAGLLNSSS